MGKAFIVSPTLKGAPRTAVSSLRTCHVEVSLSAPLSPARCSPTVIARCTCLLRTFRITLVFYLDANAADSLSGVCTSLRNPAACVPAAAARATSSAALLMTSTGTDSTTVQQYLVHYSVLFILRFSIVTIFVRHVHLSPPGLGRCIPALHDSLTQ